MAESRKEQTSAFADDNIFSNGSQWEEFRNSLPPEHREAFDRLSGRREDVKKEEDKNRDEIKPEPGLPLPPTPYIGYNPSPDKDKWANFRISLSPELQEKFNSLEERDRELLNEYRRKGRFNWIDFNGGNVDIVISGDLFRKKRRESGDAPVAKIKREEIDAEKALHPLFQKLSKEDIDKMVFSNPVTVEQLTRVVEAAGDDLFGGRDLTGEVYDGRSAAFVGIAINAKDGLTGDLVIIKEKDFFDSPIEFHDNRAQYEIIKKGRIEEREKKVPWVSNAKQLDEGEKDKNGEGDPRNDWQVNDRDLTERERETLKSLGRELVAVSSPYRHWRVTKEEYDRAYDYVMNPPLPEWIKEPDGAEELEEFGAVLNFHLYKAGGAVRVVRPPKEEGGRADVRDVCLLCAYSGSDVLYDWIVEKEGRGVYINALRKLYNLTVINERDNERILPDNIFGKMKAFAKKYYNESNYYTAIKNSASNWICPPERFDYGKGYDDSYKRFLTDLMDLSREMDRLCGDESMKMAGNFPTLVPPWKQVEGYSDLCSPCPPVSRWEKGKWSDYTKDGPTDKERLESLRELRETLMGFIRERSTPDGKTYRNTVSDIINYTPFPSLIITPELTDEEFRKYTLEILEERKERSADEELKWGPLWRYNDALPGNPEDPYPGEPQSLMVLEPPKIKTVLLQGGEKPARVLSFVACDNQTLKRATWSVTLTDAQADSAAIFDLLRASGRGAIIEGACTVDKTGDREYRLCGGKLTFTHRESALDFIKSKRYLDYEIEPEEKSKQTEAYLEQERYRELHGAIDKDEEVRGIYRYAENSGKHALLRGEASSVQIFPSQQV